MQSVNAGLPAIEKESAGHCEQVDAAPVEYLPPPQSEQATEPFTSLYVPAAHGEHEPPSGPVYPKLQLQFVMALLPARLKV